MAAIFVGLISGIVLLLWVFRRLQLEAWKRAGVPCPWAWPIFGNYAPYIFQRKISGQVAQDICRKYPDAPCIGTLYGTEPALLIQDPELIKTVLLKDFTYFNGREISKYTDREFTTMNLAYTYGDRWKVIRQNFTPLFTSSKIKSMFKHIRKCNFMLEDLLEHLVKTSKDFVIDNKDVMARYTMDNICSIGFGIDTDTLAINHDPKNPWIRMGRMIFEYSAIRGITRVVRAMWPSIFYGVGLKLYPNMISTFFNDMCMKVFKERNFKPSLRNDFVDMVLALKKLETIECESIMKDKIVSIQLDNDLLVSQCVVFFGAGFETSATALSFTLYELAKDQVVQEKAHKEIDAWLKKNNNKLNYSCVTDLPYLEACLKETLRFYPVQPLLTREAMVDRELGGVQVRKGTRIHIPVHHIHRKEEFYPDPEKYDPERYLGEKRENIKPYTYLPYGEGNRICVGIRVAKMSVMPGLVTVLKRFRVECTPDTPMTPTLDPRAITAQARESLKLRFIPRNGLDQVRYDRSSD